VVLPQTVPPPVTVTPAGAALTVIFSVPLVNGLVALQFVTLDVNLHDSVWLPGEKVFACAAVSNTGARDPVLFTTNVPDAPGITEPSNSHCQVTVFVFPDPNTAQLAPVGVQL
jgi:hypothetical protein